MAAPGTIAHVLEVAAQLRETAAVHAASIGLAAAAAAPPPLEPPPPPVPA